MTDKLDAWINWKNQELFTHPNEDEQLFLDDIVNLKKERDSLTSKVESLQSAYDKLTGEKFSDRVHVVLHQRIESLEKLLVDTGIVHSEVLRERDELKNWINVWKVVELDLQKKIKSLSKQVEELSSAKRDLLEAADEFMCCMAPNFSDEEKTERTNKLNEALKKHTAERTGEGKE